MLLTWTTLDEHGSESSYDSSWVRGQRSWYKSRDDRYSFNFNKSRHTEIRNKTRVYVYTRENVQTLESASLTLVLYLLNSSLSTHKSHFLPYSCRHFTTRCKFCVVAIWITTSKVKQGGLNSRLPSFQTLLSLRNIQSLLHFWFSIFCTAIDYLSSYWYPCGWKLLLTHTAKENVQTYSITGLVLRTFAQKFSIR